jgi:hypothetical protein
MNIIDFQLIVDQSKVYSNYNTDFVADNDNIYDEYVSIEYLYHLDLFDSNSVIIKEDDVLSSSILPLICDGTHCYHRFMIPKLEFLLVETDQRDDNNNMLYNTVCINNQLFYYNGNLYYCDKNDLVLDEYMTKSDFIETYIYDIIEMSNNVIISDLENYIDKCSQSYYCKKILFSICNLTKCFVSLQKDLIKNCSTCTTLDTTNRDFILSTIFVLDYLKDINNFKEAQRILDNITECGNFCSTGNKFNCCG